MICCGFLLLVDMLAAPHSANCPYGTTGAHPDQAALDRARHHPLHLIDVCCGHLVQRLIHGILLNPFFQGFTNALTHGSFGRTFQHTTCSSLARQHLEQHGIAHHGAHGGGSPGLGITHGGTTGQVGRLLPGQRQLLLIGEEFSLLILVDASEGLAEGVAGRQLVKAHAQHGVTSVHPRTAD
ncbi:hypothetical protein D3C75_315870 [compost metagenome]